MSVAVIGAGGIGFDVSEFLTTHQSPTLNLKEWKAEWGVADPQEARGALTTALAAPAVREVYLLQRTTGPQGRTLGKTSGYALDRGLNRLWTDGGLLYAPPLR